MYTMRSMQEVLYNITPKHHTPLPQPPKPPKKKHQKKTKQNPVEVGYSA